MHYFGSSRRVYTARRNFLLADLSSKTPDLHFVSTDAVYASLTCPLNYKLDFHSFVSERFASVRIC